MQTKRIREIKKQNKTIKIKKRCLEIKKLPSVVEY